MVIVPVYGTPGVAFERAAENTGVAFAPGANTTTALSRNTSDNTAASPRRFCIDKPFIESSFAVPPTSHKADRFVQILRSIHTKIHLHTTVYHAFIVKALRPLVKYYASIVIQYIT